MGFIKVIFVLAVVTVSCAEEKQYEKQARPAYSEENRQQGSNYNQPENQQFENQAAQGYGQKEEKYARYAQDGNTHAPSDGHNNHEENNAPNEEHGTEQEEGENEEEKQPHANIKRENQKIHIDTSYAKKEANKDTDEQNKNINEKSTEANKNQGNGQGSQDAVFKTVTGKF